MLGVLSLGGLGGYCFGPAGQTKNRRSVRDGGTGFGFRACLVTRFVVRKNEGVVRAGPARRGLSSDRKM